MSNSSRVWLIQEPGPQGTDAIHMCQPPVAQGWQQRVCLRCESEPLTNSCVQQVYNIYFQVSYIVISHPIIFVTMVLVIWILVCLLRAKLNFLSINTRTIHDIYLTFWHVGKTCFAVFIHQHTWKIVNILHPNSKPCSRLVIRVSCPQHGSSCLNCKIRFYSQLRLEDYSLHWQFSNMWTGVLKPQESLSVEFGLVLLNLAFPKFILWNTSPKYTF